MKFFTVEWAKSELSDEECERRPDEYQAHLASLKGKLSSSLHYLAHKINLHDGLIQSIVADSASRELFLELVCGDLSVGYSDIKLHYCGVEWSVVDWQLLKDLANNPKSEALYDEVHLAPGSTFEHRILFWPYSSITIQFSEASVCSTPRTDPSDRSLQPLENRFSSKP